MTGTSTKKRKQANVEANVPAKKARKDRHQKMDLKSKGKEKETEFHVVKTSVVLSIPPTFASHPRAGVEEMLDSMVMRYIPALRGVVLSHSNLRFISNIATLKVECPFLVCKVEFDATVWSPRVGMRLVGKVNLCSPDHVSLLLHRTFNVSIPRHHIPKDEWEFEYGPAENDPEYGPDTGADNSGPTPQKEAGDCGGKWVHHITNEILGGDDGYLEFTVIGLTVANEMLSLLGSIQSDPFLPEHVPESGKRQQVESGAEDSEFHQAPDRGEDDDDDDSEIEIDEDTFKALGNRTDEIAVAEACSRREADTQALEEKKNKRRRKVGKAEEKNK